MAENKWKPQDDENDDEEEDEVDPTQYQTTKDAILFAIDISPSMLSAHTSDNSDNEDDEDAARSKKKSKRKPKPTSAVHTALRCAYEVLQQRIISNPNDMMGILLFGTEQTQFPEGGGSYQHCYLLLDLDVPDAAGIKSLKKLVEDEDTFNSLITPTSSPPPISTVLFAANQLFTTKASNFQSRRLFLITDNDDPHAQDKALKNAAITRARDLYDLGVRIDPFYISNPGKDEFDSSKFYEDIIYRSSEDDDGAVVGTQAAYGATAATHLKPTADGTIRLQSMLSSILSKATPKRAQFSTRLEIGPGMEISVKGYILFKRQLPTRSHYIYTSTEKPQLVKGETTQLADDTARVITDKAEVKKAYKFGGETVLFSQDEIKQIRSFGGAPGLRLLGFKPLKMLRFMDNVKPALFIVPSEEEYIGSTRVFSALWKSMLEKDVFGVSWFIARRNASPALVAMVPSPGPPPEPSDASHYHPPQGLFLVQLPFANDIRANPETINLPAPLPLIDAMRRVAKQLHLPKGYRPEKFSNPALQWHYRILQAIALDEEMPTAIPDPTKPKYALIRKHAGQFVVDWGRVLEEEWEKVEAKGGFAIGAGAPKKEYMASRKRKIRDGDGLGDDDAAGPPKKASWSAGGAGGRGAGGGDDGGGPSDQDVRKAYEKGNVAKYTVAQLKAWLAGKKLDGTGRKADLVERVEAWCEKGGK